MTAFPAKSSTLRRNFVFLLLFCGLCLAGCATKLPDSGSLEPVRIGKETPFYLDVSAECVEEKGMCSDGLAAAIEKRLLTVDGMKAVDQPGPGTLVVRVDVREFYLAGMTRKNYLKSAGAALAFATVGTVGGAVTGGAQEADLFDSSSDTILGATIGAMIGAVSGLVYGFSMGDQKDIWAVRAGVGMAWDEKPEKLKELVVSTGTRGPGSSEEAAGYLEERLAQRIRDAIETPS